MAGRFSTRCRPGLIEKSAAGAVHATLSRPGREKVCWTSSLGPGTEVRAGRPRRYYKLSSPGRRALHDARSAVNNLWRGFRWPR